MAGEKYSNNCCRLLYFAPSIAGTHARFVKMGDKIILNGNEMETNLTKKARSRWCTWRSENGRVMADAHVDGLENYFARQRVRAWISTSDG